ncbi:hypothetical protein GTN66_06045 [bacterium]|nr:hypothetical protein [bacterium]NIN93002.1 hypothetical protein [bacterium]NIO18879.1 hypothetical protein [bacterium]NIO73958.1 hypothetical protein [bacterium]
MKRIFSKLLPFCVMVLLASSVYGIDVAENVTVSGVIKNETASHLKMDEFMKIENTVQMEVEYTPTDYLHLFGLFRFFYDGVFDAEEQYESVKSELYRTEVTNDWLRELYVDFLSDRLDVRLGRQQVVWGTADGVKILDAVNPTDMREFTLDDYADSRIPLWMLKVEYAPTVNGAFQFLFVPDFQANYLPPVGAPFTYRASVLGLANALGWLMAGGSVVFNEDVKPDAWKDLKDTTIGVRWLDVVGGFEYTLNFLYSYYLSGANYSWWEPTPSPVFGPIPGVNALNLQKRYERIYLYGASFTKALTKGPLSGLTIRGEFAYIQDVPTYYGTDGSVAGPPVKLDNFNYVLGFDKSFLTNWLASLQFIQFITSKDSYQGNELLFGPTLGPMDQVTTMLSLKLSTDFMHERLKPEILVIYGLDNDWKISPKVQFEILDSLVAAAGLHIFDGDPQNLYGQFAQRDELFLELRFGF